MLSVWHNKNNKRQKPNKNDTYRLSHNNDKTAETKLTDSFGEETPAGMTRRPVENKKLHEQLGDWR